MALKIVETRLRIAHCILEPRYSGAEILVLNLIRAQIAAGLPSAVIALRPAEPLFQNEMDNLERIGCRVMVPMKSLNRRERISWIRASNREFYPQVTFAHSAIPSAYCRLALWGKPDPVLITVLHTDNDFTDNWLRIFEKLTWRRSAAVVGVSPGSLRNYRALVTRRQNTRRIANGINIKAVENSSEERDKIRKEVFGVGAEEIVLLQVGRISRQKQQLLSIEALGALSQSVSIENIRLIFVGMVEFEDYYTELLQILKRSRLTENIQFLGSRNDVRLLLWAADAHLMPSGWEAHSIVAMEALASGILCFFSAIESFLPFEKMEGVGMLPVGIDGTGFGAILKNAIKSGAMKRRYARDLQNYDFDRCAEEYFELASSLVSVR